jgi:patatin-like phospholipase/acyl hydrolase
MQNIQETNTITNTTGSTKTDILLLGASRASTARVCDGCCENISNLKWMQCTKCKLYDLHCAVPGVQRACTTQHGNRYEQKECQHTEMVEVEYNPETTLEKDSQKVWQNYYKSFITTKDRIKDDIDANILLQGIQSDKVGKDGSLEKHIEIVALKLLHYTITPECRKILCLDGGGVRGYFTILVLQTVIEQLFSDGKKPEYNGEDNGGFLPLDHPQWKFVRKFHVLGGTSTGGLIAFCLAVGYSLYALEELYTNFSHYFYRGMWSRITRIPLFSAKYSPEHIDKRIEDIITGAWKNFAKYRCVEAEKKGTEVTLADYAGVKLRSGPLCTSQDAESTGALPTLVITSFNITKNKVMMFNTSFSGFQEFKLLDVLKATKAAPTYFPAVKIAIPLSSPLKTGDDAEEHYFVDGGVFANDPSLSTLFLQSLAIKNRSYAIVSIGTAAFPQTVNLSPHGGYFSWLIPNLSVQVHNWFADAKNDITDTTGLLVDTFMQANSDLTETFLANMNPLKVLRFKFNCNLPEPMALDDPSFITKVRPHFCKKDGDPLCTDVANSKDMQALIAFIRHYIVDSRMSTEPGRGFITQNKTFTHVVEELIAQKLEEAPAISLEEPIDKHMVKGLKKGVHLSAAAKGKEKAVPGVSAQ